MARDVKNELEAALDVLSGKGKGAKGKAPRGAERKKMWEEVRALRKEYGRVFEHDTFTDSRVADTDNAKAAWYRVY